MLVPEEGHPIFATSSARFVSPANRRHFPQMFCAQISTLLRWRA